MVLEELESDVCREASALNKNVVDVVLRKIRSRRHCLPEQYEAVQVDGTRVGNFVELRKLLYEFTDDIRFLSGTSTFEVIEAAKTITGVNRFDLMAFVQIMRNKVRRGIEVWESEGGK